MPDLTAQIRELVARLSGAAGFAPTPSPMTPATSSTPPSAPPSTPPPDPEPTPDTAAGLTAESLTDFAAFGQIVTIRSRTLDGAVYLVPDDDEARRLVEEEGVPRHRIYTPAELADLAGLFTLAPPQRAAALKTIDAVREAFGDVEVVAVHPAASSPGRAQLAFDGPEGAP